MKMTNAFVISSITLVAGLIFKAPLLWIPTSIVIASLIDMSTRRWVLSDRLGTSQNASIIIKFVLSLIMMYAMIGQFLCVGLILYWLIS